MTKLGISVAISHGSSSIAGFGLVFLRQSMAPQSSVHFEERPFILYSVVLGRKKVQQIVSTTAAPYIFPLSTLMLLFSSISYHRQLYQPGPGYLKNRQIF